MKFYETPELNQIRFLTEDILDLSKVVVIPPSQSTPGEDETEPSPLTVL